MGALRSSVDLCLHLLPYPFAEIPSIPTRARPWSRLRRPRCSGSVLLVDDQVSVQCVSRHRCYLDFVNGTTTFFNVSVHGEERSRSVRGQRRSEQLRVSLVTEIANPKIFYVATASGGILKTINAGTMFVPVFDNERVISMGDIAIAPSNPDILYAGTGEEDSRNSISPAVESTNQQTRAVPGSS